MLGRIPKGRTENPQRLGTRWSGPSWGEVGANTEDGGWLQITFINITGFLRVWHNSGFPTENKYQGVMLQNCFPKLSETKNDVPEWHWANRLLILPNLLQLSPSKRTSLRLQRAKQTRVRPGDQRWVKGISEKWWTGPSTSSLPAKVGCLLGKWKDSWRRWIGHSCNFWGCARRDEVPEEWKQAEFDVNSDDERHGSRALRVKEGVTPGPERKP